MRPMTSIVRMFIAGSLLMVTFLSACAVSPSHFRRSASVEDTFEDYRLLPGHTYYYSGPSYNIDAVVAIRDGYKLNSPHWENVAMDEQKLRRLVDGLLNTPSVAIDNPVEHGAHILNDNGEIIGAWYSMYVLPILTFKTDTEIYISQPFPKITGGNHEGNSFSHP